MRGSARFAFFHHDLFCFSVNNKPFRLIKEIIEELKNKMKSFLLQGLGMLSIISHSLDRLEFGGEYH